MLAHSWEIQGLDRGMTGWCAGPLRGRFRGCMGTTDLVRAAKESELRSAEQQFVSATFCTTREVIP